MEILTENFKIGMFSENRTHILVVKFSMSGGPHSCGNLRGGELGVSC